MADQKKVTGEPTPTIEEVQTENEQLKQALQIERENNRALQDIIIRLSGKLTGVIQ